MRYNKEGLREEIRQALLVVSRTRGQLEGIEVNGYSHKYSKVALKDVGNGLKVPCDVVTVLACRSFKTSPLPLPHNAFIHSRLVRVINAAQPNFADWLTYCYSDGAKLPSQALLTDLLFKFHSCEQKKLNKKSIELIKHLALLACQQKRSALNAGINILTQKQIAALAGKSEASWNKHWSKRWNRFNEILESLDNQGLDYVYEHNRRRKAFRRCSNLSLQCRFQASTRAEVVA
ncbi:hypothetical protein P0F29_003175 [Vibrio metschnikovii]|nr:hypothetical protein [Vibrio metschnikovii]